MGQVSWQIPNGRGQAYGAWMLLSVSQERSVLCCIPRHLSAKRKRGATGRPELRSSRGL